MKSDREPEENRSPAHLDILPASLLESVAVEVEQLGLNAYEARVLVALLRLGSANTSDLAKASGVPRTSVYQVLTALSAKRVAERVPLDGPAVWTTPGREEVLHRLDAAFEESHQEQLRRHREIADSVGRILAARLPEPPSVALPFVQFLRGAAQLKRTWEELLTEAQHELLMFTRPPYAWKVGTANKVVLATLARGVSARVLYIAADYNDPAKTDLRAELLAYHAAGVQARLAASLPIKLSIVDRRTALVGVPDLDEGFPTTLRIENPGIAGVLVEAFERYWEQSSPLGS